MGSALPPGFDGFDGFDDVEAPPEPPLRVAFRSLKPQEAFYLGRSKVTYTVIRVDSEHEMLVQPSNRKGPLWALYNGSEVELRRPDGGSGAPGTLVHAYQVMTPCT